MISGDGWGPSFPHTCLTVEKNTKKPLPGNLDPTGDRTWAHYMRGNDVTPLPQQWSFLYLNIAVNQSLIRSVLPKGRFFSLQTQHSPFYPLLSLPFRICIQSIYHNVVYLLISSSAANFFLFPFSRQFLLSQRPSQFLSFFVNSSSIVLPFPTLSSTTAFLLSSDIRSEGSIAIVKKFDFDFFMVFDSISLPHSKNVL